LKNTNTKKNDEFKPHDTVLGIIKEYIPYAFKKVSQAYKDKDELNSNLERVLKKDPAIILDIGSKMDDYSEGSVELEGNESLLNLAKLSINPSECRSILDFHRYESQIDAKMSSKSFVKVIGDVVDKEIRSEMLRNGVGTGKRLRVNSYPDMGSHVATVGLNRDCLSTSEHDSSGGFARG